VDEIDAESDGVVADGVSQVITRLVLILIAQIGKERDGSSELVVAKGLESGDSERGRAEGKGQGEAKVRVTRLGEVKKAGVEDEVADPCGAEGVRVAEDGVPVVIVGEQSRGGQSSLLDECVAGEVGVFGGAEEPVRPG
jgi:hypothetical protein